MLSIWRRYLENLTHSLFAVFVLLSQQRSLDLSLTNIYNTLSLPLALLIANPTSNYYKRQGACMYLVALQQVSILLTAASITVVAYSPYFK